MAMTSRMRAVPRMRRSRRSRVTTRALKFSWQGPQLTCFVQGEKTAVETMLSVALGRLGRAGEIIVNSRNYVSI